MIALIEGVELKGLMAPFKNTGKPVNIDTFSLDWGQFVGPIPSKARLTMKMSAPLDASDPGTEGAGCGRAWTGRRSTSISARPGRKPPAHSCWSRWHSKSAAC